MRTLGHAKHVSCKVRARIEAINKVESGFLPATSRLELADPTIFDCPKNVWGIKLVDLTLAIHFLDDFLCLSGVNLLTLSWKFPRQQTYIAGGMYWERWELQASGHRCCSEQHYYCFFPLSLVSYDSFIWRLQWNFYVIKHQREANRRRKMRHIFFPLLIAHNELCMFFFLNCGLVKDSFFISSSAKTKLECFNES